MTIVQIKPEDFGLTSETAANIAAQFKPMLAKMEELENEFNEVVKMPLAEPSTEKAANELLRKYVKVRTGTAAIHKEQKDFYLKGGRFVDGWKNAQLMASHGKEEALERIVNYRKELEAQRIQKLQEERAELIARYVDDTTALDLGRMSEETFQTYLAGAKKRKEDAEALARAAEEEVRLQKERDILHNQRRDKIIPLWRFIPEVVRAMRLDTLSDEEFAKVFAQAELDLAADERAKEEARAEAQRLAAEKVEADRKRREAEAEAERLRKEQEDRDRAIRVESERKAAEEAQRLKEEKAEAERRAKAPIKEKMTQWVSEFTIPTAPCENMIVFDIEAKFEAFKKWALTTISQS
jgi:hypothetical protein